MAVILFGGDKGGVGKSTGCMAFIDWAIAKNKPFILIEGDTSNDNVFKAYKDTLESHRFNLGSSDGWREMMDLIENKKDANFVVNTPARIDEMIKNEAEIFEAVCSEVGQKVTIFWMLNRQRDSILSFKRARSTFGKAQFVAVKNLYFGLGKKFVLWDESTVRAEFDKEGGETLEFPELNDRAADRVINARLTFTGAANISSEDNEKLESQRLMISDKTDIQRWLRSVYELFDSVNERL